LDSRIPSAKEPRQKTKTRRIRVSEGQLSHGKIGRPAAEVEVNVVRTIAVALVALRGLNQMLPTMASGDYAGPQAL